MRCPSCGAEVQPGKRFCADCGTPLAARCPSCGAEAQTGKRFCADCGAPLSPAGPAAPPVPGIGTTAEQPAPVAERRVCSVLFADLVGFTTFSESRDAETVRELLSGYFDLARRVITRYGGSVEKFIGDAVMAVWGVPESHEDDAERCVRAGLELLDAVAGYGEERGVGGLAARAGVVTGEVAVTLGARGEGMVAGDAVNTAARVQAAAEPGSVLTDETTRQASARAIAFADAGVHRLKGKAEPVRLWRATRVLGSVGGSERVDGLEASFLGRDREFRALKEAFHTAAEGRRARLVSVLGVAGVGKSRLGWEFNKYIDGLAEIVLWHAGRCLSYGEGVAYWALAEMVRQRFAIPEQDSTEQAAARLTAGLERWIADPADREFMAPRLGALLGLAEPGLGKEELFAGWRLFFERLAEQSPVVLAFEDAHWADAGLLDFIDFLMDWSADSPIFVLCFSRPELAERRPGWAGRRNAATLPLDPLPAPVMHQLLAELVPGLPEELAERIVAQADGIPLYAVETVRSLIDRELVRPIDGTYRLVGHVAELEVPASLASLIAARIDALPPAERSLVQDLAVLGTTFPRTAVAGVSRLADAELDGLLVDLVRREILAVRADRLSPDRGHYTFTQALLRQVAYDTLSRRERKVRHITVAAHLRSAFPEDGAEVAEVVARHYQDALEAIPDDADATQIRVEAVTAFLRAGARGKAVGAPETAERAFATAAALAADERQRADALTEAGEAAMLIGDDTVALEHFEAAMAMHETAGRLREAAGIVHQVSRAMSRLERHEQAIPRVRAAIEVLAGGGADPDLARLHGSLAWDLLSTGAATEALPHVERALELAEALDLPEVLAEAAERKGVVLTTLNRPREGLAALEWSLALRERHGLVEQAVIAHGNAADACLGMDLPGALAHGQAALAYARRRGSRYGEVFAASTIALSQLASGQWGAAEQLCREVMRGLDDARATHRSGALLAVRLLALHAWRGELEPARAQLAVVTQAWTDSADIQSRTMALAAEGAVNLAAGLPAEALAATGRAATDAVETLGTVHEVVRQAWPDALEAALTTGDLDRATELLALLADHPIGHVPPYLRAQLARYRARLAAARGDHDEVEDGFREAERILAELDYPYWLALARLDHASWLLERDRPGDAAPLLAQATGAFQQLGAAPAAHRAAELTGALPPSTATVSLVPEPHLAS